VEDIRSSIEAAVGYLSEHPDEARYRDSVATATLERGLRFRVTGPGGEEVVTDMPPAVGGGGEAPSPGWLYRAAAAACAGSLVAMEAARDGVRLTSLAVEVDGESDDRGILGMAGDVPPGPLSVRIVVRVAAEDDADLEAIVRRAVARCPVTDALGREVPTTVEVHPG
jgi:uncharacterized OsmC-like protein